MSLKSVYPLLLHTRRVELINVFTKHSHNREHRSQELSFHSAQHQININRTEDLVWRRTQKQTTVTENASVVNVTQTTRQQPVRTSVADTQAQSASPESNQTTPQQITKFDPGLLDRLTDDIIRRVEKRARVERQRRGL